MARPTIDQLAKQVQECCEEIAAAGQLGVSNGKSIERLRAAFNEFRRGTNARLEALEMHVRDLMLHNMRGQK